MNEPHLLLGLSLHQEELDDAGRLVDVEAHGGGWGEPEVHVLCVVPDLVTGARPAHTPRAVVLTEAAGPVLVLSGRALTHHPHHHPAIIVHLPVPSVAQQILFGQDLKQSGGKEFLVPDSKMSEDVCKTIDIIINVKTNLVVKPQIYNH